MIVQSFRRTNNKNYYEKNINFFDRSIPITYHS